ncbi:hypothetical protein [Puniceibacterium confluentis]|uniref:hypothetical protein n=1 Tax=Puniceibacterium confluentis TaxID=1958944 RepID=UPI0011B4DC94|nr:hypothetical protein [Puniceibacterium confluentis]
MTRPAAETPPQEPCEARIATLVTQLRLLGAQADALRADLARRDAEIAALSARLLEADARAAAPRGLWSRLTRR